MTDGTGGHNEPAADEPESEEPEFDEPVFEEPVFEESIDLGRAEGEFRSAVVGGLYLGPAEANIERPHATGKEFDPSRARELMRGGVALASIGLFAFVVVLLCWAVVFNGRSWNDVQGIATSILPVVVSVVGTTTGFYFGTKSSEK